MNYPRLAMLSVLVCVPILLSSTSRAQQCQVPTCIFMTVDASDQEALKANTKTESKNPVQLKIVMPDSRQTLSVLIKSRGQSSIRALRKNFLVESLDKQIKASGESKKTKLKFSADIEGSKIILTSMTADYGYVSNRIGYATLSLAGLPFLPTTYAEVFINGVSNGLYLVSPRPVDQASKFYGADFISRRRYFSKIEVTKVDKDLTTQPFLDAFQQLYTNVRLGSEADMRSNLELDQYFKWIGVNFLLGNGDYSDEVFFIAKNLATPPGQVTPGKFQIFPWDYDDLFKSKMHSFPQNFGKWEEGQQKLIFNFEDLLDRRIAQDEQILNSYHKALAELLSTRLTESKIKEIIIQIRRDITPFLRSAEVLSNSSQDDIVKESGVGVYSQSVINDALNANETFMLNSRTKMMKVLASKKSPVDKQSTILRSLEDLRNSTENSLIRIFGSFTSKKEKEKGN